MRRSSPCASSGCLEAGEKLPSPHTRAWTQNSPDPSKPSTSLRTLQNALGLSDSASRARLPWTKAMTGMKGLNCLDRHRGTAAPRTTAPGVVVPGLKATVETSGGCVRSKTYKEEKRKALDQYVVSGWGSPTHGHKEGLGGLTNMLGTVCR